MVLQDAAWLPVPDKRPTFDPVDLLLEDGSVLCGCLPQSNGNYWWEGPSGEVFIDPRYAPVTHWRLSAAREAKPIVPREAIEKMLTQLMDIAVSNGANSISMPDEYVEVAAWLCGIPAQPTQSVPDGWRLVPIEPTLKMQRALIDGANQYDSWLDGYRDMLAAAPEFKP